ncbi:MAG TPA: c-type cytochrome [Gammaproteobacteria bacterium]|nr:c-type cytochrome [Gammaproteobacteria bacterium]
MKKMRHAALLAFVLTVAAGTATATEDAASGGNFEQKLAACGACHGEKGDKPLAPEYPILAGQKADYLSAALRHYRDGRRNNPIMGAQVQALQLTEDDIVKLGEYFSQQSGPLSTLKN